jgi:hypothetical protein
VPRWSRLLAETGRFSGQFVISETMRSGMCVAITSESIAAFLTNIAFALVEWP